MRKSAKFIILSLIALLLAGCASMDKVLVLNAPKGTNLFLRNTELNTKNKQIPHLEFDVTVNVEKSELSYNPIVNYTLTSNKTVAAQSDKIVFFFENNGQRFKVVNPEMMFRTFKSKKKINVRYTSELEIDDMNSILGNYEPVSVVLVLPDNSEIVISDKKINEKFNDLRVIAK